MVAAALVLSLAGCGRRGARVDAASMTEVDPAAPAARRIVSLVPSATETLFALGVGDRVVGVSTYDDYPPEATARPRVGGMTNPSFEAIVALRPDAVVGVQGPIDTGLLERLRGVGVRPLFPRVESIDEALRAIDTFGALVRRPDAASALRARVDAELRAVRARAATTRHPRTLAVFSQRPMIVAGPGSWVDELLRVAGGDNVVTAGARYPTVPLEQARAWAPEVVLDLSWQTGGGDIAAGLAPRVVRLDDPVFVRPGPRLGEAARRLCDALQGPPR